MTLKVFSVPSAKPRGTMMSRGREHYEGRSGVRVFHEQLMKALPDLALEVRSRHVTDDAILLEVMIRGTYRVPGR